MSDSLRKRVIAMCEWSHQKELALAIAAMVAEECAEIAIRTTPDREAVKVIGEAAHYMACAVAIRKHAEGLK